MLEFAATLDPKSSPTALRKKGVAAVASSSVAATSWRDEPVGKRLEYALIKVRRKLALRAPCSLCARVMKPNRTEQLPSF
jgi:hypothetical protein